MSNGNFPIGNGGIIQPEVVCEGSGVGFVTCVKNWLDKNKGKCLTLTEKDGTYYADDDCQN